MPNSLYDFTDDTQQASNPLPVDTQQPIPQSNSISFMADAPRTPEGLIKVYITKPDPKLVPVDHDPFTDPMTGYNADQPTGENKRKNYMIEPNLAEQQMGQGYPKGSVVDEEGNLKWGDTGEKIDIIRRPGVLPLVRTPDGVDLVMPKIGDILGSMMGGVVAPVKGAGMVLGSGPILRGTETASTAVEKAPVFFSAVEHQINNINQAKMTGEQWLGTLANKPGVKPEELQWTGLQDFLKENANQPVTKEQLQQYMQANKVELKEVNKGKGLEKDAVDNLEKEIGQGVLVKGEKLYPDEVVRDLYNGDLKVSDLPTNLQPHAQRLMDNLGGEPTKYHSYQLPGANNYREMLMTLPKAIRDNVSPSATASAKYMDEWNSLVAERQRIQPLVDDYNRRLTGPEWEKANQDFDAVNKKMDILHDKMVNDTIKENPSKYGEPYRSSHWDEPNILAHVRMNDRTIEGKKALHIEEIQSDWHQQGRDKGYKGTEAQKKYDDAYKAVEDARAELRNRKDAVSLEEINKVLDPLLDAKVKAAEALQGVPDAPFKKSWHELALKRMIREAAEKGYDRLSWTPGEAQAARYDLSKSVDQLLLDPKKDGSFKLVGRKKGGNVIEQDVTADKLPDIVGKEAAKNLLAAEKNKYGMHELSGQQLKIGGEGMKGFYDQIIPKALEKLTKEKVKSANIAKPETKLSYEELQRRRAGNKPDPSQFQQPVHYIDLPQSLKDTALHKGFPLFSSASPYPLLQVDHDPFNQEQK